MDIFALKVTRLESKCSDHEYPVQLAAAAINVWEYSSERLSILPCVFNLLLQ
jgi:hypothetical protein